MADLAILMAVLCFVGAIAAFILVPKLKIEPIKKQTVRKSNNTERQLITYKDANGDVTTRSITIKHVTMRKRKILVRALCHLRKADRTFVARNIISMQSAKTGMSIDPIPFLSSKIDPDSRPCQVTDDAFENAKPVITALKWIANADGEIAEDEQEILVTVCADLCGHNEQLDKAQLSDSISDLKTTLADAKSAFDSLGLTGQQTLVFESALNELVAIGGPASAKRAKKLTGTT